MRLLDVSELKVASKHETLVKGISFHINRSEIVSIVGESGSGKSLSCLSILNLLPKSLTVSGRVEFHDEEVTNSLLNMNAQLRAQFALKKIAYIFQEPLSALNPVQQCGKQLLENIYLCGFKGQDAKKRAKELLLMVELVDTDKVMNAYPFELSGGQRQRVMIAMALAGNPDLIIADEPTTALDVLLQDEILGLIKKLTKEHGKSVLFVSHDLDAVRKFSDRILVMYKGEIIETGTAEQIIKFPKEIYTKALLACKPNPDKKGHKLLTIGDFNEAPTVFQEHIESEANIVNTHLLHKEYFKNGRIFRALKSISFNVKKGQSVGLIGESGSGKSTISKLLVQLEEQSGGSIEFDFENNKPLSSNVQMIFQDPFSALNPLIRVGEMLKEVIHLHQPQLNSKEVEDEIKLLLTKVGLSAGDINKYPSDFSGGQRQRICIARALAVKPKLLICDESTSALDLSVQAQILNLLKELQIQEGLSILMITHSMAVAAWFCSYLIVLKDGYIIEQGLTDKLIKSPSSDYTKAMIAHI
ncbi:MAG: ABC transporter ATP-binding protein [Bacteroidia bacterium]|nr:ABC transporter ATP-binding protein [Bacteroidia bacterium]